MARAIWRGTLELAGSTLSVKLYTAVGAERVQFHFLHRPDRTQVRQQMFCPVDREAVDKEHWIKGFEVDDNEYVVLEQDEIDALEPVPERAIEFKAFVVGTEIDPRYYDRVYYLGPQGDSADFAALGKVLEKSGRVAICSWTMRKRAYLGVLKLISGTLCLITLRYQDEIVDAAELKLPEIKVSERELSTAVDLIDALSTSFEPAAYRDEFQLRLRELIAKKAQGESIEIRKPTQPKPTSSKNLLHMLEASVKQARFKKSA